MGRSGQGADRESEAGPGQMSLGSMMQFFGVPGLGLHWSV